MPFYGKLFLFCRAVVRAFMPRYRVLHTERIKEPAVYLCRHSDLQGILMTVPWLPVRVRIWALAVFCDVEASYRHLREITFIGRYRWPRWFATAAARLASYGLAALLHSGRVIPVFRGSPRIRQTFRLSTDALKRGESLLIFPDKDYVEADSDVSDLYKGFLRLDVLYHRATGQHIPFIPLYGDRRRHTLTVYEPLRFSNSAEDEAETSRMLSLLKARLSGHGGPLEAHSRRG